MRGRALRLTIVIGVLSGLGVVAAGPAGAKTVDTVTSRDGIAFQSITFGDQTALERVSPDPALVLTLDEPLELRLVEPGGQRVVLGTPLPEGADAYHPGGRASTHLVVVDVATRATRSYDLPRNIEPEAFGVGVPALFVIDHRPAAHPTYYRVASMSLETGQFSTAHWAGQSPARRGHERDRTPAGLRVLGEAALHAVRAAEGHRPRCGAERREASRSCTCSTSPRTGPTASTCPSRSAAARRRAPASRSARAGPRSTSPIRVRASSPSSTPPRSIGTPSSTANRPSPSSPLPRSRRGEPALHVLNELASTNAK